MNACLQIDPLIKDTITANPDPMEAVVIARAQSLLTANGEVGPVLPYQQALDIVRWAEPAMSW
jgi:hypothetical protein